VYIYTYIKGGIVWASEPAGARGEKEKLMGHEYDQTK
jgi:hypothetical protein